MDAYRVYFVDKYTNHGYHDRYYFELPDALDFMDKYLVMNNHARVTEEEVEIFWEDLELTIDLEYEEIHLEAIHIYKKWEK